MIREKHGIRCMPCSSRITSDVLSEIHTVQNFDFLKPIIHSQIINSLFVGLLLKWRNPPGGGRG